MKISTLKDSPLEGERVITIGAFDGIHLGHQALINRTLELAKALTLSPALVTFDPHPRKIIQPHLDLKLLTPLEEKIGILENTGVPEVILIPFTKSLAELSADIFIERYLVDLIKAKAVVVGFNFRFGRARTGDGRFLQEMGQKYDFQVEVIPPITMDGKTISSTTIRELLKNAELDLANKFLGRPYTLKGKVIRGKGRGKQLGFPTANLDISPEKLIPAPGVYAVKARIKETSFNGAMNIGIKPTFQDKHISVEVHLLDCEPQKNLYGEYMEVSLIKYIRQEKKFSSPEELISQIQRDCQKVLEILS
ncbi:MAG: bifunctional riboflavin kinase/FAD synthetase [Caldimicrobium sp.]|nr:bifunctional riboflavin kinase/FAD synthetase [Caldimicrobium sp.]MDW8183564.1 bifunctional riboflavin kinase/FAD synthetase [Caldimicrobium sp.]